MWTYDGQFGTYLSESEDRACHKGERFMVMHGGYPIAFVVPDRRSVEFAAKENCSIWARAR